MSRLGKPFWQCANDDEFLKLYNRKYGIAVGGSTFEVLLDAFSVDTMLIHC